MWTRPPKLKSHVVNWPHCFLKKNIRTIKKKKRFLTCHCELDLFGNNGAHTIFGVTSIVASIGAGHWLDLVKVFWWKVRQKYTIFHPTIFNLGKSWKKNKNKRLIMIIIFNYIVGHFEISKLFFCNSVSNIYWKVGRRLYASLGNGFAREGHAILHIVFQRQGSWTQYFEYWDLVYM